MQDLKEHQLVNLLLQQAKTQRNKQPLLKEVQEILENFKTAELEDYFQSSCAVATNSTKTTLNQSLPQTAIIYPVLLADRIEIIVRIDRLYQFILPVTGLQLNEIIKEFRYLVVKRTTREYRRPAKQLFDWLIQPYEKLLKQNNIKTLVFIPDGLLRTIPIAALYDGKKFLIEKYAVTVSPGLTLTDLKLMKRHNIQVLLSAITQSVGGYPPLPYVFTEIKAIRKDYSVKLLKDKNFTLSNFEKELVNNPYSVVHIASHGQFHSDPNKTFLLTYDTPLTMDRLEQNLSYSRYSKTPIELLTLSACQTAAGDEKAALGLAGVALKAGARSALATLWYINDQSSAMLVAHFYQNLLNKRLSKADALKQAQLLLIRDFRFKHPGDWAPFLLIGNWL